MGNVETKKNTETLELVQKQMEAILSAIEKEKESIRYVVINDEKQELSNFENYLKREGCAHNTVLKYKRDIKALFAYMRGRNEKVLTEEIIMDYREHLVREYEPASVNSMLSSIEKFLIFHGIQNYRIPKIKIQKRMFSDEKKELGEKEYKKLLEAAKEKKNSSLSLIIETIGMTGIRISELKYFTVQGISRRKIRILNKGKARDILISEPLRKKLLYYAGRKGIKKGMLFVTRNGKEMDRSNIWKQMKRLGEQAEVLNNKIYPHNLRHLFARTFYTITKDVVKLADILGHSNVSTTRIYLMGTGKEHRKEMKKVGEKLTGVIEI